MSSPRPLPYATVGELLQAGARLFRLALPKCLPIAMIAALVSYTPSLLLEAQGRPLQIVLTGKDSLKLPTDAGFWAEYAVSQLIVLLLFAVVTVRQRALLQGQPPDLRREFSQMLARLPVLLPAVLLGLLAYCAGLTLFILPGVYLAVCFCVLSSVVLFEDQTVFGALRRSIQLMHAHWMRNFAVLLIGFLIALVCLFFALILVGVFLETSAGSPIVQAIQRALDLGCFAVLWTFLNSLSLTLYTSASSSA